jgi:hypothetical protein
VGGGVHGGPCALSGGGCRRGSWGEGVKVCSGTVCLCKRNACSS